MASQGFPHPCLSSPAHPSASCPKTFVGWRHTCRNRASCGFPLAVGAACPARCRQGFEFPAAGACRQLRSGAQAKGKRWGEGEAFAREGLGCHPLACSRLIRFRAVARGRAPGWCGGSMLAGTTQARARLLLPCAASLCFGFAPGFRRGRESPGDGGFMHITESDMRPGQEETVLSPS